MGDRRRTTNGARRVGCRPWSVVRDDQVRSALDLRDDHALLYLIPVGHPAE